MPDDPPPGYTIADRLDPALVALMQQLRDELDQGNA